METVRKIEVFGDSIFKGIQVNPENKRYRVENYIDIEAISREHSMVIHNHSQFGCTIQKGFTMLKKFLTGGASCDFVVMDYGGNDCDFNWKEIAENPEGAHSPKTPLETFLGTYKQIIQMLKEKAITPVLTTLPPLQPQKFFDWFCRDLNKQNVMKWLGDIGAIYRYQEKYSRAIESLARETGAALIDLRGAFLKFRSIDSLLCEDGVHPNTAGQRLITAAMMEFAGRMKISGAAAFGG